MMNLSVQLDHRLHDLCRAGNRDTMPRCPPWSAWTKVGWPQASCRFGSRRSD